MMQKLFALFPWYLWLAPWLVFGVSAPLWLHVWEPAMFLALNRMAAPVPAPIWTGLSLLGNGWAVLALTAPLLVLAPRLMWAWICAAPFAALFARAGKSLLESPRPAVLVDPSQMRVVGELLHNVSMPSGHTTTAFAVAAALWFALPSAARLRHSWLLLLALAAGFSRIAVGAHWPGDVAVGAALGLLSGLLGNVLLARMPQRFFASQSWGLRVVALLVLVAVYHLTTEALDFDENRPIQRVLAPLAVLCVAVFAWRSVRPARA